MSVRTVFPELFHGACADVSVDGKPALALRWSLHPDAGLPKALFHVWQWSGAKLPTKVVTVTASTTPDGAQVVTWPDGAGGAVAVSITVPSGATATLRAMTRDHGGGRVVDEVTVAGPATSALPTVWGSPVGSVVITGSATVVGGALLVPLRDLLDSKEWLLVERIGLPVTKDFDATGYPTGDQGVIGAELPPVDDAIRRVKGGHGAGWPTVTDRGLPAPIYVAPDASTLVIDELAPLIASLKDMLVSEPDPAAHAAWFAPADAGAPRSLRGVDAQQSWQDSATTEVAPLGVTLLAAASDSDNALALGFGTTRPGTTGFSTSDGGSGRVTTRAGAAATATAGSLAGAAHAMATGSRASSPAQPTEAATARSAIVVPPTVAPLASLHLVTVEHSLKQQITLPLPGDPTLTVVIDADLSTIVARPVAGPLTAPTALATAHGALDRPDAVDAPWNEVARVSWAMPPQTTPSRATPVAYAVARALGVDPPSLVLPKRTSGGAQPFVPAVAASQGPATRATFVESGLAELFPAEPPTYAYSVAPADVFGRWGGWTTTDHARITVATQVPAVRRAELTLVPGDPSAPVRQATVAVEFVWDWADRTPEQVQVRVIVHPEGAPPPDVGGSVLALGAAGTADLTVPFATATETTPPPGTTVVADDTAEHLRTYRVEVPVTLDFGAEVRIRATARARAAERVRPGAFGGWSPDATSMLASPTPPPPAFVPAAMTWASVPDPRGIARVTLTWTGSAPAYAVLHADEAALRNQLGLPAADLEVPADQRLPELRAADLAACRGVFRRVADRLTAPEHAVALPRGSKLIQFYGVVPISAAGVEGALPADGNAYLAVAAPRIDAPELPALTATERGTGEITVAVDVPEGKVLVDRIEVYRTRRTALIGVPEAFGPPIATLSAATDGVRADDRVRFTFVDPAPGPAWRPVYYRCVAIAATDRTNGRYGGRSPMTRAVEVVPSSVAAPPLAGLIVDPPAADPAFRLVRFDADVPLIRSYRGAHGFAVRVVGADAAVAVVRADADGLPTYDVAPTAADLPGALFRHAPPAPAPAQTCVWVPADSQAVVVEIVDPAGQKARLSWPA